VEKIDWEEQWGGAKSEEVYAYTATRQYSGNVNISQEFLYLHAKKAMEDLRERILREGWKITECPGAVCALKVPGTNTIYLASSIKGPGRVPGTAGSILGIDDHVVNALRRCRIRYGGGERRHHYQGKCAEVMVTHLWFSENPTIEDLPKSGKLIVTVNRKGEVKLPCNFYWGSGCSDWGCKQFLLEVGFTDDEVTATLGPSWEPNIHGWPRSRRGRALRRVGHRGS